MCMRENLLQFSFRVKLPSLLTGLPLNTVILLQFCNIILYNFVKSKRLMTSDPSPWQRWELLKVNIPFSPFWRPLGQTQMLFRQKKKPLGE